MTTKNKVTLNFSCMYDAVGFYTNFHSRLRNAITISDRDGNVLKDGNGSKEGLIYGDNLSISEDGIYGAHLTISTESNVAEIIDFVVCGILDDTSGHSVKQTYINDIDITELVDDIYNNVSENS